MFQIDRMSEKPIYEQIIEQMKKLILLGIWNESDPLPSVRTLSRDLSINPNTLQKAYAELEASGLCFSDPGNGRFVSPYAVKILKAEQINRLDDIAEICAELALAGVPLERIIDCTRDAYHNAKRHKKGGAND